MRAAPECLSCFVRQALAAARRATTDPAQRQVILRQTLRWLAAADWRQPPPVNAAEIYRIIRRLTGEADPYAAEKRRSNALALRLHPELRRRVAAADDPLVAALQVAVAGNIIDFGIPGFAEDASLETTVAAALTMPLDPAAVAAFRAAVARARRILYLGDNAGEIVFDRLLLEQLPREKLAFVVRGRPVINDATLPDTVAAGLPTLVEVIDNGADLPGTVLEYCSPAFRRRFAEADVLIAKGQGNYETLDETDKECFFLLKVKCAAVARQLGRELGTPCLLHHPSRPACGP